VPKVIEQLHSRPPLERMLRIHAALQEGKYPNCSGLATEIEVSTRTIKRDVDFMKYRLDLPIEYDAQRYGYYYSEKVDRFPTLPITEADVFALLVAHKAIHQYRGTPFEHLLETSFRKLTGHLDGESSFSVSRLDEAFSFRPFGPEETDLELFQFLLQAMRERREVRFQYRKIGAKRAEERTVRPYHVACVENRWYLFAFDPARNGMRAFVLGRMSKLELLRKTFTNRDGFDLEKHLRGSLGVFVGRPEDDFDVVIEFDAWAADVLRGRRWHWSQSIDELPRGQIRMRMRLNNLEEVERWVLSWGAHATVIAPLALARRIESTAAKLGEMYMVLEAERAGERKGQSGKK
jgi:predicted DNA-binding transcriptional regulator YafY